MGLDGSIQSSPEYEHRRKPTWGELQRRLKPKGGVRRGVDVGFAQTSYTKSFGIKQSIRLVVVADSKRPAVRERLTDSDSCNENISRIHTIGRRKRTDERMSEQDSLHCVKWTVYNWIIECFKYKQQKQLYRWYGHQETAIHTNAGLRAKSTTTTLRVLNAI